MVGSGTVRLRPDINNAFAVAVFVVSSCVGERRPAPLVPASPPPTPAPAAIPEPARQTGFATFYAKRFTGRRTASGERYDPQLLTAAHRQLPFGTMVEVRRSDGRSVVVRINDRGPYGGGNRVIDLSRRAAEELGIVHDGKALVELRPLVASEAHPR